MTVTLIYKQVSFSTKRLAGQAKLKSLHTATCKLVRLIRVKWDLSGIGSVTVYDDELFVDFDSLYNTIFK